MKKDGERRKEKRKRKEKEKAKIKLRAGTACVDDIYVCCWPDCTAWFIGTHVSRAFTVEELIQPTGYKSGFAALRRRI